MNNKLLTTAVAGALALPAIATAEEHTSVSTYGRINNAIQYTKPDGAQSVWGLRNVTSRLGIRASTNLGGGLTAIGSYEFFTYTNREGDLDTEGGKGRGGINDTRLGYVGLRGAWGSVTVGNQWSSFYDIVGTHLDPTYSMGYFLYSSTVGGTYRTSNTIKWANSFGPVYTELDMRLSQNQSGAPGSADFPDEERLGRDRGEDLDGWGLGATWAIGDSFILAAAIDKDKAPIDTANDTDRAGIAGKWTSGAWWASLSYYQIDVSNKTDMIQGWVGTTFGKTTVLIGYGRASSDAPGAAGEPTQANLGIYHRMGGGLRLYFEGVSYDDKGTVTGFGGRVPRGQFAVLLFGMRYDFSS